MARVFAILGDIHANIDALTAVLDDARSQGVTDFASVGDVVGYNAAPVECLRIVRDELGCPVVRGNHDHYVSHDMDLSDFHPNAAAVVEWTRSQLTADDIQWLHDLPMTKPLLGFTLVHSTLDLPEQWGYVFDKLQAEASFFHQRTALCFHGHTHVPVIYEQSHGCTHALMPGDFQMRIGQRLFINVGSVGQPRDGNPDASYLIYDMATRTIRFRRVPYDVQAAQERILRAGLPVRLAERLALGN